MSSNVASLKSTGGQGDWPPSWNVGEHSIAVGRYIDPAFARLEYEKLWSKVWQWAARLDEIPEPGDFTTYDIGDQSVFLVRVDADTVKGYYNVCPHRGTALSIGCGHFANGKIICPFHGWRWDLTGRNEFVLERQEFRGGKLQAGDVALREVKVEVWAGFVFVNLEKNPQPFGDFIAPVKQMVEDLAIGQMHHYWWKSLRVRANWKVAQEAFFETYHVPATHPQLDKPGREVIFEGRADAPFNHHNVAYDVYPRGHGRFYGGRKTPMAGYVQESETGDPVEDMITRMAHLTYEMDAMVLQEDIDIAKLLRGTKVPEGSSLGAEYVKLLYQHAALQQRPMPTPKPETLGMWGGEVYMFPNLMILPNAGNAMLYRTRPDASDPDYCIFEIYSTKTYPAKDKLPRAVVEHKTDGTDPDQFLLIPRQDMSNIPRMQKGLHSKGIRNIWLASEHEKLILNMHQELDRYLRA
jgi:phenylpropionate dioxygenase-like ring-hydroxylating dioxygenase large terminal subunit